MPFSLEWQFACACFLSVYRKFITRIELYSIRGNLVIAAPSKNKAFYFFTSIGNFTGRSATSLEDFLKEIGDVDAKSLEFHLQRRDFEKWSIDVLGDTKLAREIRKLRNQKLTGKALRNNLRGIISRRYEALRGER